MQCSLSKDLLNSWKILFHISDVLKTGGLASVAMNPVAIEIHPTAKCNHQCIHCSYKERNESRLSLDKNIMEQLIDSIIAMKVKAVYFSGGGEPTVYPDLVKYVEKLYNAGIDVALLTNGSILSEAGITDIAYMFNYIAVSVPSVNQERFKYITGSDRMDYVLNCAAAIKLLHSDKAPIVGARVILTSIVYKEIRNILETLKSKEWDYVIFKIVRDYEDRGLGLNEREVEEIRKIVDEMKPVDSRFTNLDSIFNYRNPVFERDKCIVNELGLLANVNCDGKVYPNIVEIGQEAFCVGNLYHENLETMWHSASHQEIKKASHIKWSNKECKNCRAMNYNRIVYEILGKMPSIIENFV
jgi:radical SAM protein with 4Fe4S-binding SPASM domain